MTYQAKNNAFSTLAGSLTNIATTLTVQTGHGDRFPVIAAPDYTILTLEDSGGNREIIKVTARTAASDTMTIVRGQEGTTARSWSAGDSVELRITAGEIQTVFNHVDDTADAHAASAITNTPSGNLAATTVQAALNELQTDVDTRELSINAATAKVTPVDADATALIDSADANKLKKVTWSNVKAALKAYFDTLYAPTSVSTTISDHVNDTTDAHAASAITNTPAGNIAATTVQAAINELDSEKQALLTAASQAEMEAGTEANIRSMSPLRVKQAINALAVSGFSNVAIFYSSGTFTVPAGVTKALVTVVGGGGGGGGASSTRSSNHGGKGGLAQALVTGISGDITITVGAGGAGSSTANGSAGGTSSFGSAVSATGGGGGVFNAADGADGTGTVSSGTTLRLGTNSNLQAPYASGGANLATTEPATAQAFSSTMIYCAGANGRGESTATANNSSGGIGGVVIVEY